MAIKFNAKTGMYEDVDAAGIPTNKPVDASGALAASPYQDQTGMGNAAYTRFKSNNAPTTDTGASNLASNLMGGYGGIKYDPKNPQSYIPQDTLAQLGKVTGNLANYQPEKINVSKVETMPVEYYQKQVEDLSKPLTAQYETSRASMRGDQAARGNIYDSSGYTEMAEKVDKPYIEQLGNITRGVQEQRMAQENQNAQDYATRYDTEALNRRSMGLEGLTAGGNLISGVAGMYGNLGAGEQERAITTALQNKGLDANTINSLLGYGADRYKTEAGLFGDIYGQDTDYNKSMMEDARTREQNRRQAILDMLGLTGYTDQAQGPLWESLGGELGYPTTLLNPQNGAGSSNVRTLDENRLQNYPDTSRIYGR